MKHRNVIGFVWFWGLWASGSTLEYFGVMPTWPLFLSGIIVAAFFVAPRPRQRSAVDRQPSGSEQLHTA